MPNLDSRFVQVTPLQDYFVDKDTGFPLSGGIVAFYEDNDHTVLKPVYQLSAGPNNTYAYNVLSNPLQLSSVGTFIDGNRNDIVPYFFPYDGSPTSSQGEIDLYYITVYSSAGIFQFSRNAWPNISSGSNSTNQAITENLLSNPQFSVVNFNTTSPASGFNFTVTGSNLVTNIAPDWDVITTGTGNVTVQQVASVNTTIPGNPPYLLDIQSVNTGSGISSLQLRQRLNNDPRILVDGFANGSFVVGSQDSTQHQIIMSYVPSGATATSYELVNVVIPSSNYSEFNGTKQIDGPVINPDSGATGYVDILITIPAGAHIQITCVQFAGVLTLNSTLNWIEQTTQRELDHLYHDYNQPLQFKPTKSYLIGWDFPLNPAQVNGSGVAATSNVSAYTWDQTILFQSTVSKLDTSRSQNGAMVITSTDVTNATQAAVIQYLSAPQISDMLENPLSVNVECDTINFGGLTATVSLWYTTNVHLPNLAGGTSLVTTLDANGHPSSVVSGWNEIIRLNNVGNAQFLMNANLTNFGFNGWNMSNTNIPNTASFFAIVIGTSALNNGSDFSLNSVSLVPGNIPTKPATQTPDDVLRECQYFYEKSYDSAIKPGTASSLANTRVSQQLLSFDGGGNAKLNAGIIAESFNSVKITPNPQMAFYSPITGTAANARAEIYNGGTVLGAGADVATTNWTGVGTSSKNYSFVPANGNDLYAPMLGTGTIAFIYYHYTCDARLGLVAGV